MSSIQEKIKLYFRSRRQRVSVSGVSIQYDWAIILGLTILMILASAIYSIVIYRSISGGRALVSEGEPASESDRMSEEISRVVERLNAVR